MSNIKIKKTCTVALKEYLGLDEEEVLLIITDEHMIELARNFYSSAQKLCKNVVIAEIQSLSIHGEEPPQIVGDIMKHADVVLCITKSSLNHTQALRTASNLGVRIGVMPDVTDETILRMFPADYSRVVEKTEKLKELMATCEEIKIESELGTNLILPVKNRRVIASTGVLHNIGASGNIPSGEASITPWEDKAYGTIVIDGTIGGLGKVINPITIEVVDGTAVSFTGKGGEAKVLSRLLNKYGEEGKVISAFGMGTNHNAIEVGMILEDEKVEGMVHVSFGNNMNLGGRIKIPMHIDATMTKSDVFFDNEQVVAKGKLLI